VCVNGHFASVDMIAPSFKKIVTNYEPIRNFPFAKPPGLSGLQLSGAS
jgi:hypothetical protein